MWLPQGNSRNPTVQTLHFLDSSVARKYLGCSSGYRNYLSSCLDHEHLYVSAFVQMELRRSFLLNVIAFYFLLRQPDVKTLSDALHIWSNRFKTSEAKAVLQLVAEMARAWRSEGMPPPSKSKVIQQLGLYIVRIEGKIRMGFKNTGVDRSRCERARILLQNDLADLPSRLKQFADAFEDVAGCRAKCKIDAMILTQHQSRVRDFITHAAGLPSNAETSGYKSVSQNLGEIMSKGASACSCSRCGRIGDAVIALDSPRAMQLEHVDKSFNQLCARVRQPHRQLLSEQAVLSSHTPAS